MLAVIATKSPSNNPLGKIAGAIIPQIELRQFIPDLENRKANPITLHVYPGKNNVSPPGKIINTHREVLSLIAQLQDYHMYLDDGVSRASAPAGLPQYTANPVPIHPELGVVPQVDCTIDGDEEANSEYREVIISQASPHPSPLASFSSPPMIITPYRKLPAPPVSSPSGPLGIFTISSRSDATSVSSTPSYSGMKSVSTPTSAALPSMAVPATACLTTLPSGLRWSRCPSRRKIGRVALPSFASTHERIEGLDYRKLFFSLLLLVHPSRFLFEPTSLDGI